MNREAITNMLTARSATTRLIEYNDLAGAQPVTTTICLDATNPIGRVCARLLHGSVLIAACCRAKLASMPMFAVNLPGLALKSSITESAGQHYGRNPHGIIRTSVLTGIKSVCRAFALSMFVACKIVVNEFPALHLYRMLTSAYCAATSGGSFTAWVNPKLFATHDTSGCSDGVSACPATIPSYINSVRTHIKTLAAAFASYIFTIAYQSVCHFRTSSQQYNKIGDDSQRLICGAGTTIMESLRHGRDAIGVELKPQYAAMARDRIVNDAPMFNAM
jgi:hypothetical protein